MNRTYVRHGKPAADGHAAIGEACAGAEPDTSGDARTVVAELHQADDAWPPKFRPRPVKSLRDRGSFWVGKLYYRVGPNLHLRNFGLSRALISVKPTEPKESVAHCSRLPANPLFSPASLSLSDMSAPATPPLLRSWRVWAGKESGAYRVPTAVSPNFFVMPTLCQQNEKKRAISDEAD